MTISHFASSWWRNDQQRVKQALEILPDKAVRDLGEDDLAQWLVVRVNDEITVDLMTAARGVSFDEASPGIETVEIDGVPIPFASAVRTRPYRSDNLGLKLPRGQPGNLTSSRNNPRLDFD